MRTEKKSKWILLISIGLLIIVLPAIIEHLISWNMPDWTYGLLMGIGIGIEILGLILFKKDKRKHQPS